MSYYLKMLAIALACSLPIMSAVAKSDDCRVVLSLRHENRQMALSSVVSREEAKEIFGALPAGKQEFKASDFIVDVRAKAKKDYCKVQKAYLYYGPGPSKSKITLKYFTFGERLKAASSLALSPFAYAADAALTVISVGVYFIYVVAAQEDFISRKANKAYRWHKYLKRRRKEFGRAPEISGKGLCNSSNIKGQKSKVVLICE